LRAERIAPSMKPWKSENASPQMCTFRGERPVS
jgi:hypothetical protein